MRYVLLFFKLLVFALLLGLALQNSTVVPFYLFFGQAWQAPLIVLLLGFFVVGTVFGLTAGFVYSLRQRRELSALKKELRQQTQAKVVNDPSDAIGQ